MAEEKQTKQNKEEEKDQGLSKTMNKKPVVFDHYQNSMNSEVSNPILENKEKNKEEKKDASNKRNNT